MSTSHRTLALNTLYAVTWEDSTSRAEWHTRPEAEEFLGDREFVVTSVGTCVACDEHAVLLAARTSRSYQQVGLLERIPQRAIIDVSTLVALCPSD